MDPGDTLCQSQKTEQKGRQAGAGDPSPNVSSHGEDTQADAPAP